MDTYKKYPLFYLEVSTRKGNAMNTKSNLLLLFLIPVTLLVITIGFNFDEFKKGFESVEIVEPVKPDPIPDTFIQVGFTAIGERGDVLLRTVYDVETKVMYLIAGRTSGGGSGVTITITPLYNPDGSLRVWNGD